MTERLQCAQSYQRGVVYAVVAGIFLSTAGLIIRYLDTADAWTVLFYRSWAFSFTVVGFMWWCDGPQFWRSYQRLKFSDLIVTVALSLGFIFYVLSLFNTSVANTVLLLSTGPFFAAVLGWLALHEVVGKSTWLAIAVAVFGVAIMVSGDTTSNDLVGMGYAVAAVLAFAIMIVALRFSGPGRENMAATSLAGILAAFTSVAFVPTFQISAWDLLMSLCLGCIQVGVGFILITLSTRSVPSAQVPLFALGETALAPLWVWLLVNEIPAQTTLIGGALVIAAVVFKGLTGFRETRSVNISAGGEH